MSLRTIRIKVVGLTIVVALFAAGGMANAAPITILASNPTITVDENGVGTIQFPGGLPIPLPGVLAPDPGPGGLALALTYNLLGPPGLISGDLILSDSAAAQVTSDVIRFNPAGTGNPAYPASLVFYSDNADGVDALADTGFPTQLSRVVNLSEVGPESGPNGVTYTPNDAQPGFVPGFQVTYVIQSDPSPVPEPATVLLVGTGMAAAFRARARNKRQLAK